MDRGRLMLWLPTKRGGLRCVASPAEDLEPISRQLYLLQV